MHSLQRKASDTAKRLHQPLWHLHGPVAQPVQARSDGRKGADQHVVDAVPYTVVLLKRIAT